MLFDRYGEAIQQPGDDAVPEVTQPQTPLTSVSALYTLSYLVGEHRFVDDVVSSYDTWEELVTSSPTDRAYRIGVWSASLQLPQQPVPLPELSSEVSVTTRYDPDYPAPLLDLPNAPALLYSMGDLPPGPYITIGGSYYPSQGALEMTRMAVQAAVQQGLTVVAVLDSGCGHVALQEVIRHDGQAIAIGSGDLGTLAAHALIARRILDHGGAIVSEWGPGEAWTGDRTFYAARLAAALGSAVILPEVGSYPTGGSHLARYSIALGKYLIIPHPRSEAETPYSGGGTTTLAKASNFREEVFGTGPRIQARLRSGYTPADAVIENGQQLAQVLHEIRVASGA